MASVIIEEKPLNETWPITPVQDLPHHIFNALVCEGKALVASCSPEGQIVFKDADTGTPHCFYAPVGKFRIGEEVSVAFFEGYFTASHLQLPFPRPQNHATLNQEVTYLLLSYPYDEKIKIINALTRAIGDINNRIDLAFQRANDSLAFPDYIENLRTLEDAYHRPGLSDEFHSIALKASRLDEALRQAYELMTAALSRSDPTFSLFSIGESNLPINEEALILTHAKVNSPFNNITCPQVKNVHVDTTDIDGPLSCPHCINNVMAYYRKFFTNQDIK
jgi:hypothetical protein